jgi:hypothetical protein
LAGACNGKFICQCKDAATCDDGNACNTGDTCNVGKCAGTGGKNCDDGNPCTTDTCDDKGGCVNNAVSDGQKCTEPGCVGNDYQAPATCSAGKCGAKPALLPCDDKNVCTNDLCNAAQGCLHTNNTAPCDDGNKCTQTDSCSGGGCNGQLIMCDDKNVCTDDSCDPATGCVFKANTAPCDDADACTTKDTCSASACKGGAAPNCDDGNLCTTDGCAKAKGCTAVFNTVPCDDNNKCTTSDACASGKCAGGPPPVCNDNNVCTNDSCDKLKGCQNLPVANGSQCIAGSCSTLVWQPASTCQTGKCTTPATQNCDDALECTNDACSGSSGCSHANKAWGTARTPSNSVLKWPFCAGSLCTGYEIVVQQPNVATRSVLTGITRSGGKVFASGAGNAQDTNSSNLRVGTMSALTSSPLASQHNAALSNSVMRRVANLVSVGASTNSDAPRVMTYDATSGFWANNGTLTSGVGNRRLIAVATYPAVNKDWYAITAEPGSTSFLTNLYRVAWTSGGGFAPTTRMLFSTKPTTCSTQVEATLHDMFPASASAVYFVGTAPKAGGGFNSVVGFYDGNSTIDCGGLKFDGAVWTDNSANDLMVTINTGSSPAVGGFRAVHGRAAGDVLVAGEHGTVFSFNGSAWNQEQPNTQGLAWNSQHYVFGVWTAGTQAWAAGVRVYNNGVNTCRAGFVLHGEHASGTWAWNKLVSMNGTIETCAFDANNTTRTEILRAWVDATTGDVWFVGSQGTNSSGGIVQQNASQTRQLLVRVKTK